MSGAINNVEIDEGDLAMVPANPPADVEKSRKLTPTPGELVVATSVNVKPTRIDADDEDERVELVEA